MYTLLGKHGLRLLVPVALLLGGCDLGEVDDDVETFAAGYPTCSAAASDPDGDGWGWEPAHSCVRPGSGLGNGGYPTCSGAASDPDGDGWGWEPARSCQVAAGGARPGACAYVDGTCTNGSSGCRVYDDYGARAGVKSEIWQQMYGLNTQGLGGLAPAEVEGRRAEARCRADLAVAIAMQEAHSFATDAGGHLPYDHSKDGKTDGSQNVCVFNMNIDFLKRSCRQDCGRFQSFANQDEKKYLNRRSSLGECVRRLNEGFDHFGIDGTLHFHRGGSSGWEHPGDDERRFARAQKVVADHLRDHVGVRSSETRVAETIPQR